LLLLIAVALAISAPGSAADQISRASTYSSLKSMTFALDRAVTMLQCGLLVSLFLFSRYFVLTWRSHAFGIALGLGVFASVELATSAMRLYFKSSGRIFDDVNLAIYQLCVLIWMFYLMSPAREPKSRGSALPDYDLEIWNRELQRLIQQ